MRRVQRERSRARLRLCPLAATLRGPARRYDPTFLTRPGSVLSVLGVAISVVLAYVAVRDVDFDAFWKALRSSNYWWLIPSLATLAAAVALRALRWRLLFDASVRPPFGAAMRALLIMYLFNNVLPARAGEAVRIVALHRESGTSRAVAVGTAVAERIYDVVCLLVLLFVAAPFLPAVEWLRRAIALGAAVAVAVVVAILVLEVWGARPLRFAFRVFALLPGVSPARAGLAATRVGQGLAPLHRPRAALRAFGVTLTSYVLVATSFSFVALAFHLSAPFGLGVLALVTTNLAMVIPSAPAAVGVFEASTLAATRVYGIEDSVGLSYAVVLHAVNFLPYVVVGLFILSRHPLMRGRRPPPLKPVNAR